MLSRILGVANAQIPPLRDQRYFPGFLGLLNALEMCRLQCRDVVVGTTLSEVYSKGGSRNRLLHQAPHEPPLGVL